MSADSIFSEGNEAFADDEYSKAVKKYTAAIEQNSHNPKYYSQRANAFIKLEKYEDALADTSSALRLDTKSAKAFLRKGIAHYRLKQHRDAKEAFENALKLEDSDETKSWISNCDVELQTAGNGEKIPDRVESKLMSEPPLPKAQPKPRYDWYQTDSRVVVTILVKNRTSDDVKCDIQDTYVSIYVRLEDGSDFSLSLNLANTIVAAQSKYKVSSPKVN
ncbi:SGT1 homolog [Paramuricea clavata]|uniref:SGT1 homolog n=1 Tax=Paramuricea clavata TaxID=317549 RepID=A0A6S7ING5_PARCT|nr:SGT1 homolog [Paramuricea clavata]